MKIKLDENLPESLLSQLARLGHDVDNVRLEGVNGCSDPEIWQAAQEAGRFFVTQDLDFSDIRQFAPGTHHGLMLVRLHAPGRLALVSRITEIFGSEAVENWSSCFVLLTDHKLRIQAPPK